MARGLAIKDVTNKLQDINNCVVIPVSSGANMPEVMEVRKLKEYINEDTEFQPYELAIILT